MSGTPVTEAPYGSWPSPISAEAISMASLRLAEPRAFGTRVYWLEGRASENGRVALMLADGDDAAVELLPDMFSVRTRAREYGGGAYEVHDADIWFVNAADQCIYQFQPGAAPRRLTAPALCRYAALLADPLHSRLIAVGEFDVEGGESTEALLSIDYRTGAVDRLCSGADFYAGLTLSADARRCAWLSWQHPNMPWDATELMVADVAGDGSFGNTRRINSGHTDAVFQPQWGPDGGLYFVSDRNGWWNLWRHDQGTTAAVIEGAFETGLPQWVHGMSTYGFYSDTEILCAMTRGGFWSLTRLDTVTGSRKPLASEWTAVEHLAVSRGHAVLLAGAPDRPASIVSLDPASGATRVLQKASAMSFPAPVLSRPEAIEFPTTRDDICHALYYPPTNEGCRANPDQRPPLLLKCHGGPTAAASPALDPRIQFWTSRGFALLEVNYRGSTGYGREYRRRLDGEWGVLDVDDCVHGAGHLARTGVVDPDRLLISGGSAGGFAMLCALTFHDCFHAGASYYGIGDLEALFATSHRFESRYDYSLLGPTARTDGVMHERSPIRHASRIRCPVIFFQGLDDRIVPPSQSTLMVQALADNGLAVAYLRFAEEGHGFRRAATQRAALEAELYFYGRILGFTPADQLDPVPIRNLDPQR